jgi:hypothetical protein
MCPAASRLLALLLLIPAPAQAQEAPALHARYDIYAAGLHVAEVDAAFSVGPRNYDAQLAYHTTGLVGFFRRGEQLSTVAGTWDAGRPGPREYQSVGVWRGENRETLIDYLHGQPLVRRLIPPQDTERAQVPLALQSNSVDPLSALALLIRRSADTGRCDTSVRTFDGNRASEITSHTSGEEVLAPSNRSIFSGRALRCDFVGQVLAGFLYGDATSYDHRPVRGSVWLASMAPGEPPVPVQMEIGTRWFGTATTYLTRFGEIPPTEIAAH